VRSNEVCCVMLCLVRKNVIFVGDELCEVWMKEGVARCNIDMSLQGHDAVLLSGWGRTFCCGCVCRVKQSSEKLESVRPVTWHHIHSPGLFEGITVYARRTDVCLNLN